MTGATWEAYAATATKASAGGVLYVQFRDYAGNLSPVYGTDGSDSSLDKRRYMPLVRR
jgi:hypothetical protein